MIALERSDQNMKSKTKTLPTDAVLRDMLKQAGLDSAGCNFGCWGTVCSTLFLQRRQTRRW